MHDLLFKHAIILSKIGKIRISTWFVFIIFSRVILWVIYFINTQIFRGNRQNSFFFFFFFFQDWFPNLFLIFESFLLPVFEICIILSDATEVQNYSTFNLKFSRIFKANNPTCVIFFKAKFSDWNKPNFGNELR